MVSVENVVKQYGDFCLNISMEIPDGVVTGLIGKNGAGKSTTIKSILGLITPDSGRITIGGKDAGRLGISDKAAIGVALSDSGFSSYLNVNDIIHILKKMYREFDTAAFLAQCQKQGLPLDKRIKDFSTGMRAKLRVLTAISHNARLLILDEPTAGLDVMARNEILDMLRHYLSENEERSMLISSHISSDLEGLCDDIYMINNGKIILHEDTDTILGQYAVLKVNEEQYQRMDRQYLLKTRKEPFGYICLTKEKKFYLENYPDIVIENGNIDELIVMMSGGN